MKLVECPVCGAPQLLDWTLEQYTLSDRLRCQACGYNDFVYVFLGRDERSGAAHTRIDDGFAAHISEIVAGLRPDTAVSSLLSSLSRRYRLSTVVLVDIINSLLASKGAEPAPYNPLSFVTIDESAVDAATLLRRIDEAAAAAAAQLPSAVASAVAAGDSDRWRMQYEQCMIQLDSLYDKNRQLREVLETLKAENRRLREYMGE
ncbi:MAG: hypothetical protein K2L77_01435 [Muribaculaceae bacterium]|nr:hypothetical protein [Muribaculaceae bacterium]